MSTVTLTAKQASLLERWRQILNDPQLDQYENFRIETDGNGEILMSPRPPKPHNFKATKIATMLVERLGGEAAIEPQIITGQGVKVPDACWLHPDRYAEASDPDPFIVAPEICVEVLSPSNYTRRARAETRLVLRRQRERSLDVRSQQQYDLLLRERCVAKIGPLP